MVKCGMTIKKSDAASVGFFDSMLRAGSVSEVHFFKFNMMFLVSSIFSMARRCVFWNMTEWRYNSSENILTIFIKIDKMDI